MNPAMNSLLFGLALYLFNGPALVRDNAPSYSQTYAILIKGSLAGSETVTETPSESGRRLSISEHDITVTDGLETKRMTFSTRMLLTTDTLEPLSYSYQYTSGGSGDSYEVTIKDAQVTRTLRRGDHTSEVTVPFPPGTVILDFNVYHQYDYLLHKYNLKKGGRQSFSDFIPLIGSDIPIALTFLGNSSLELGKRSVPVKNFRIEFVGIWNGTVSTDKDGRLVRLLIPTQELEVIRKDLLSEPSSNLPKQ